MRAKSNAIKLKFFQLAAVNTENKVTKHHLPILDRKKVRDIFLTEHASKERKKRYVLGIFFLPKGQKQRDQNETLQACSQKY